MFQYFLSPSNKQVYTQLRPLLSAVDQPLLDTVLELSCAEAIAKTMPLTYRDQCLVLLKSDDPVLVSWLNEISPQTEVVIQETILRTLLSLTVE